MKTVLLAFTALLSMCGGARAGLVRTAEDAMWVADVWWKPMTNAVAMSKAFGEMYCLGEGGTEGYFKRVLESELSRRGGGDTNILALALDVLAWGCDPPATGVLERALFDSRNPLRAETFFACVVAAQADQERLAVEIFKRIAPKERLTWYRRAVRMCPSLVPEPLIQGMSPEIREYEPNPLFYMEDGKSALIRANYRLQFHFFVTCAMETDPACAHFMDSERHWRFGRGNIDNDRWEDGVYKRLAERFMKEPGETGRHFKERYNEIGDRDKLRSWDIQRWRDLPRDEPSKRKWLETKFRLNFNFTEASQAKAYKKALEYLCVDELRTMVGLEAKRTQVRLMLGYMEDIGIPPDEIKATLDSIPDTFGVVYPFPKEKEGGAGE